MRQVLIHNATLEQAAITPASQGANDKGDGNKKRQHED